MEMLLKAVVNILVVTFSCVPLFAQGHYRDLRHPAYRLGGNGFIAPSVQGSNCCVLLNPSGNQSISASHALILSGVGSSLVIGSPAPAVSSDALSVVNNRSDTARTGLDNVTSLLFESPTADSDSVTYNQSLFTSLGGTSNYTNYNVGQFVEVEADTTGTVEDIYGVESVMYNVSASRVGELTSFLSAPTSDTGSVEAMIGYEDKPWLLGGNLEARQGVLIHDFSGSGGTVGSNIGIKIEPLTRGVANLAIDIEGDTPSQFGPIVVQGISITAGDGSPQGICSNGSEYRNRTGHAGSTIYYCIDGSWQPKF